MDEARGGPAQPAGGRLVADAGGRSPYRTTCPYFRLEGPDGTLLPPLERPDPANRCTAIGWPVEPSLRQQAMGCLTSEHTSCPRYVHAEATPRDAVVPVLAPRPQPRIREPRVPGPARSRPHSRATLAALLLLVASGVASFTFVLSRGSLTLALPAATGPTHEVAGATATPASTEIAAAPPTAEPTPTATPTPTPEPTPTATPTPTLPPTPEPTARPTPRPTSDRYAFLEPCPNRPNCWIYTIRRGDALSALANYFGHPLETIYRLNPWTKTRGIHPGDQLILPPPTR